MAFIPCCPCPCPAGLRIADSDKPVPLKSIEVNVTVKGFIANVTSSLVFKNTEETPIEALYEFPMDDQSAVFYFEAKIEDRVIIAECQEKKQAKETYDEAISQGFSATLMEEDSSSSDIFRCLVGNIPANTDAVIKFSYVTELTLQPDGVLQFALPTLLNPRYNPHPEAGGSLNPPIQTYVGKEAPQPYSFTFKANVISTSPILTVTSSKDELNVTLNEIKTQAQISLKNTFKTDHDLSFDISYGEPFKPHVLAEPGLDSKDGLLKQDILMLNFFPELSESDRSNKHEFLFVIDRSGSMQGPRIEGAKETLLLFLKSLPPGCYFNIIGFGSEFKLLFPEGSREYSEASLDAAVAHQKVMDADLGGTEILQPLVSIYSKPPMATHSRQILLLTDGEVYNTSTIIDEVRKNANNTRVFTFGIGEGASTTLVKGVARAGRGTAEFIKEGQRMQPLVMKTLKAAMQSAVTDLHLDWQLGGSPKLVQVPEQMPPLFAGSRLIVYAISPEKSVLDGQVLLKGKIGERILEFTIHIDGKKQSSSSDDSLPVHRLAAKAQIQQLQDQEKDDVEKNKAAIILLSTAANIISRHTSMVGVDKTRPEKVTGDMMQRRVPMMQDPTLRYGGGRPKGAMMCAPQMMSFHMMCSAPMPMVGLGAPAPPVMMSDTCESDSIMADCEEIPEEPEKKKKEPDYMDVVSLQSFSGSWKFNAELVAVIEKTLDDLEKQAPLKALDIWATLLALALLEVKYAGQKDEWEMIEIKAMQWLSTQNLEGHDLNSLITKAKQVISV